MNYTLITHTGKLYTFYVKAAAEIYLMAYGGTLVDNSICYEEMRSYEESS